MTTAGDMVNVALLPIIEEPTIKIFYKQDRIII